MSSLTKTVDAGVGMQRQQRREKVLLMGKRDSGKTSMRSIIFANLVAKETMTLAATLNVDHDHETFLGALRLNLWDCAGQASYFKEHLTSQKHLIFDKVRVLIYVFDFFSKGHEAVMDDSEVEDDIRQFRQVLEVLNELSPQAKVFILVHKMDLVPEHLREKVFDSRRELIEKNALGFETKCFKTSIWDETLFKAWSVIVNSMIPNIKVVEDHVRHLCDACDADEVVLFEKNTFLVISKATRKAYRDLQRFEKISNIVKQFKLACKNTRRKFDAMSIRNSKFTAYIEMFTSNTAILVVVSDKRIQPAATKLNIRIGRKHFERLLLNVAQQREMP